jgi:cytochrome b subunit of formate dehydrogenase
MMRRKTKRETDIGTILLHWLFVVSLVLSTLSGLRFAVDMPDNAYMRAIEPFLLVNKIWMIHVLSGVAVMGLTVTYILYLRGAGLQQRIWPSVARLAGLLKPGSARWGAINIILYWCFFICILTLTITGVFMHRGYGGFLVDTHLLATWLILAYAIAHVLAHLAFGGFAQLLRVFRPKRNFAPTAAASSRRLTSATILSLSAITGAAAGWSYLEFDRGSRDTVYVVRAPKSAAQNLNPDLWENIWRNAPALYVHTNQGTNFNGSGATLVEIRAVHDDDRIYFAFSWEDPTRSLRHAPLIKAQDGWHALVKETEEGHARSLAMKTEFAKSTLSNYEGTLSEDKFAVMLVNAEKPFGPGAFHPGAHPIADKPPSSSGRGLHYTEDGSSVNLWLWHANGVESGRCENNRVGAPAQPTADQVRGSAPYKGGYVEPVSEETVSENFTPNLPRDPALAIVPRRLPKNLGATQAALLQVDLDPDHSDPENARWWLTEADSVPFTSTLDADIPIGTIIPGIIAQGPRPAGAADIHCSARWTAGRWTLLASRLLQTGHGDDVSIGSNTYMWVGAFDHAPAGHTRHIRPIKLELR